ncbi:MAG: thioredoxin domain-containing protein, partial [Bacteroidota bacterium]
MPTFRSLVLALVATTIVACGPANGQTPADNSDDRKATIIANLKYEYPQIAEMTVEIDTLESVASGMDRGQFLIQGQSPQPFLVTSDDTQLYLLASDAIDVSRSTEELAAAAANADADAIEEARARGAELAAATNGLPFKGPEDAPVTIVEFSDFQCSFCGRAAETVRTILSQYPEDVKLVYAHFPLSNHPWATPAAIASTCAAQQDLDAFWMLHDLYFAEQRSFSTANVMARSRDALANTGIDMATWDTCATDESSTVYQGVAQSVQTQMALGEEYGVRGTPGF